MDALVNKSEIFQQKVKQMMDDEKFRFAHLLLNYYNIQKQLAAALQKDLYSENVQKLFTLVTFLYKFYSRCFVSIIIGKYFFYLWFYTQSLFI